ncbi:MAG: DUF3426 domain-containing protein, partial [Deltaproteobacteria bacterium]|nr:DUF3426 domain-containing protein [Deltaproteobacteria bacterium]
APAPAPEGDFDFGGGEAPAPAPEGDFDFGGGDAPAPAPEGDFDFGGGDASTSAPAPEGGGSDEAFGDFDFNFSDDAKAPSGGGGIEAPDEKTVVFSVDDTAGGNTPAETTEDPEATLFAGGLTDKEIKEEPKKKDKKAKKKKAHRGSGKGSKLLPILVLIIIGGVVGLYFSGKVPALNDIIDNKLGGVISSIKDSTGTKPTTVPVEITRLKGDYYENETLGTIFTLKATIKNNLDKPQKIRKIRGVIKDKKGKVILESTSRLSTILSVKELKTLTKTQILKRYKKPPFETLASKTSTSVMVVFTTAPAGIAQASASIEIYP